MNLTIIGIVLGIISAVGGYIAYLKSVISGHAAVVDALQSSAREAETKAAIAASNARITEDERDYAKARDSFIKQFGSSDDSNGGPGPSKL